MANTGNFRDRPANAEGDLLVRSTLRQLVLVALAYRGFVTVVAVAITASSSDVAPASAGALVVVGAVVVFVHSGLLIMRPRVQLDRATPWIMACDVGAAVILNLWASGTVLSAGDLYRGYGDPFGAYAIATLALWTAVRGARVGAHLLLGVMLPLQLAMAAVNGVAVSSIEWARFVMRCLWLVTAFVIGYLLANAFRQGRNALAAQSERAGRQAQRRETLDTLHNLVLQTLVGIDRRSRDRSGDPESTLAGP